jgi:sulfite exporter TauE/SafE
VWLERGVGLVMIGLGIWTFRGARTLHAHRHAHDDGTVHEHVHSHALAASHDHGHAVTAVGLAHGLAGSGSAVALIPVVGFDSSASAIAYLLVFALGTVAGMAVWGLVAGTIVGSTAHKSARLARVLARITGVFTVIIGVAWLLG